MTFPQKARYWHRHWWIWVLAAALVGIVTYSQFGKAAKTTSGAVTPGKNPLPQTVSVTVMAAKKGDINTYLTGLGSVTPLQTVTVKTRVDGELMRVYYKEGQIVKKGQLLAEIDSRPY
jgi:membrane fusion protein, multidrug efflux system